MSRNKKVKVYVPITPWCTGKSTEQRKAMEKFAAESDFGLIFTNDQVDYICYLFDNNKGEQVLFIYESPALINIFFDRLGHRQFDNSDRRQLIADTTWHEYMLNCIDTSGASLENLRIYCDFHPFSGTRYRQLNMGTFDTTPIVVSDFCLVEYAFVPEGYDTPVYFAGPFGKRTIETRGHIDIDAADEIPLRMIGNIPSEMYVRSIMNI